jgi:hypothetical protein
MWAYENMGVLAFIITGSQILYGLELENGWYRRMAHTQFLCAFEIYCLNGLFLFPQKYNKLINVVTFPSN